MGPKFYVTITILLVLLTGFIINNNLMELQKKEEPPVLKGNPAKYSVTEDKIPLTYYGNIGSVGLGYRLAPQTISLKAREAFYDYKKPRTKAS